MGEDYEKVSEEVYPPPPSGAGADPNARWLAERIIQGSVQLYTSAEPRLAHRFALAQTSLSWHFTDAEPLGFTLLLDRAPVEVLTQPRSDSEIDIYLTAQQLLDVYTGRSHLTMEIARGNITYEGTVRKFLALVPLHKRLDFRVMGAIAREYKEHMANGQSAR
ncbi:MAG TPA: hypothetical protein VHX88_04400 [Solirubrobacteraceae bacterium]|jgi:hypothetical protein|nr:hypothetical protein [Solirubrobacteraceae bacterium]